MTRLIIIADGGPALERLSDALSHMDGVALLRHLGGRRPVAPHLQRLAPDLVFIDEPAWSPLPLALIREVRSAAPAAAVIVRAAEPTADWLADALMAGATAVLPAVADGPTLALVVQEVMAGQAMTLAVARFPQAA